MQVPKSQARDKFWSKNVRRLRVLPDFRRLFYRIYDTFRLCFFWVGGWVFFLTTVHSFSYFMAPLFLLIDFFLQDCVNIDLYFFYFFIFVHMVGNHRPPQIPHRSIHHSLVQAKQNPHTHICRLATQKTQKPVTCLIHFWIGLVWTEAKRSFGMLQWSNISRMPMETLW